MNALKLESGTIEAYRQLCTALSKADDVEDRRVAHEVMERLAEDRSKTLPVSKRERLLRPRQEGFELE